jgi:hypothetical protein
MGRGPFVSGVGRFKDPVSESNGFRSKMSSAPDLENRLFSATGKLVRTVPIKSAASGMSSASAIEDKPRAMKKAETLSKAHGSAASANVRKSRRVDGRDTGNQLRTLSMRNGNQIEGRLDGSNRETKRRLSARCMVLSKATPILNSAKLAHCAGVNPQYLGSAPVKPCPSCSRKKSSPKRMGAYATHIHPA